MKSTDCIRVPVGILEYMKGDAEFALENATKAEAYLRRYSTVGTLTDDETVEARVACGLSKDYANYIVGDLQEIIAEAES